MSICWGYLCLHCADLRSSKEKQGRFRFYRAETTVFSGFLGQLQPTISLLGFFGVLEQLHLQETLCGERHALLKLFSIVFFHGFCFSFTYPFFYG